jgi:hypothetical protein
MRAKNCPAFSQPRTGAMKTASFGRLAEILEPLKGLSNMTIVVHRGG